MIKNKNFVIPKIEVKYSILRDVQTYFRQQPVSYPKNIDEALKKFLPQKIFLVLKIPNLSQKKKEKILQNYLKLYYKRKKYKFDEAIQKFKNFWAGNGAAIIKELEEIYQIKLIFKKFKIYMITFPRCPYNYKEKWFAVNVFGAPNHQLDIAKHELNHFFFHKKFNAKKKEIGIEIFNKIKESFTIISLPKEKGYQNHQNLRKNIKKWHKEKKSLNEIFKLAKNIN
ncbi:MAG: hypothetical protein AAB607_01315 [Patescibacteria group bacterium]